MKRFTAILMTFILFIIPFTAYAEKVDSLPMMGDVNNDGRITAADAREILRYSAKLSANGDFSPLRADTDGNGSINAADARNTLRAAAHLSGFNCGFNKNGAPCATDLLKAKTFVLKAATDDAGFKTDMTIAIRGDDLFLMDSSMQQSLPNVGTMSNMGIMFIKDKVYSICTIDNDDYAILIPSQMIDDVFGDDFSLEDIKRITNFTNVDDYGMPEKLTENGKTVYKYTYLDSGEKFVLTTDEHGRITSIMSQDAPEAAMTVFSVTSDDLDSYFDLSSKVVM